MTDYKLMPVEPIPEMLNSAMAVCTGFSGDYGTHNDHLSEDAAREVYQAFMSSAPAVQGEPASRVVPSRDDLIQCLSATHGQSEGITADAILSMLTAAPQPAGQQQPAPQVAVPTPEMIEAGANAVMITDSAAECAEKVYRAMRAAAPHPAPDVAELLNRIIPRIDAGGPNPIDPDIHCCEWTLHRDRERIHAEFADALAAHRKPSVAPCCGDPGDCWEPCGELGKSEAHVRVSDHSPDAAKMVPVPYELLCRLADEDFRSEVPDDWVPEMTGPDGSKGPATFTVGDLRAAADLVRAFEGGEA